MYEFQSKFDPSELYRTDPAMDFMGHLFEGPKVQGAGVTPEEPMADDEVQSLCGSVKRSGPFVGIAEDEILEHDRRDLDDEDRELCARCVKIAAVCIRDKRAVTDDIDPDAAPFDPSEYSLIEIREKIGGVAYEYDDLLALWLAESEGKDRESVLETINRRRRRALE